METGAIAALQMSFDAAKKVGELIPKASQELKSPPAGQAKTEQPAADFAAMMNSKNTQTFNAAVADAQVGSQLDVYA